MYFTDSQRIPQLETELLEELKSYKYKQVIHPSLREGKCKHCEVCTSFAFTNAV